jgi:hypothetical protein
MNGIGCWTLLATDWSSLCGRVGVGGLVPNSPVGAPALPYRWRYSYQVGRVEVLVLSGYRVSGPRPAAVGVTELGGIVPPGPGRREVHLKTGVAQ